MSRSIFPKVVTDYFGIKAWSLSEKDKKEVASVISRNEESEYLNAGNKIANSLLNVVDTAIFGAAFYLFQNYQESQDKADTDDTEIDEYTRDGLMVCGISLMATTAASIAMRNYVFAANDVANVVKDKIYKMSPEDLVTNLQKIDEIDLATMEVPKNSTLSHYKIQTSYLISGLITNFSNLPEDKKYLLFAASRVVTGELLDIAEDILCLKKCGTVRLFEQDFLDEFSEEEQARLRKAIKSELESNLNKNSCSEGLIKSSTNLAQVFAFFGTIHNVSTSPLFSEEVFASAANFGTASLVSKVVRLTAESLNNYSKIRKHPQVEEVEGGDVEMGVNKQHVDIVDSSIPEIESDPNLERRSPSLKISKRSKSENDLGSSKNQNDHFQPLVRCKSENDLIK